jgi:hypothetical protein
MGAFEQQRGDPLFGSHRAFLHEDHDVFGIADRARPAVADDPNAGHALPGHG